MLTNLKKDDRSRFYLTAERVLWSDKAENTEILTESGDGHASLSDGKTCHIMSGGGVMLDFGREIAGRVNIIFQGCSGKMNGKIRVRFGESAMEAMSDIGFKNATNDHAIRDTVLAVPALGCVELGASGFRFVRIDVCEDTQSVDIKEAYGVLECRDLEYKGSFESNDELLNKIWQTGAYTVHLNMQDYLLDGIKRDRLVWIGDMHPETSTVQTVFGYDKCVSDSLDHIKNQTKPTEWMNTIPTYSMWWIKIHRDWYFQNGNLEYLKEQEEYISALLEHIFGFINADGTNSIENRFIDWPSESDAVAKDAGMHAMIIITIRAGQEIFEILGNPDMQEKCRKNLEILAKYKPDCGGYKQAAGLLCMANPEAAKELNEKVLSQNPYKGLSTFLGYYTLQARAMAGDIDGALDICRTYWGKMLELGATTFWEDFNLDWAENCTKLDEFVTDGKKDIHGDFGGYCYEGYRHSLCHGWASGPTAFLSQYVLGVKILEPGCKKVKLSPQLGQLDYVKGTYPTPYGIIEIEHKRDGENIITKVKAPAEVEIEK